MVTVKLLRSRIGITPKQKKTLDALGLRKIRQEKTHEETPVIMGMINKVSHMVEVTKS